MMAGVSALRFVVLLAVVPLLAAWQDPRDCWLGIAHRDCAVRGSDVAAFPQDDAICRAYGLEPGTPDYVICREKKRRVRALTEQETDYGFLQNSLIPDVTVVPPLSVGPR